MPRSTPPVKRVYYAETSQSGLLDQIPPAGIHDQQLPERCRHLPEGKLAFDPATKSTDTHPFQTHPTITLEDTQLPLERSPKILVVIMHPSLSFHKHCNYVTDRKNKRNIC